MRRTGNKPAPGRGCDGGPEAEPEDAMSGFDPAEASELPVAESGGGRGGGGRPTAVGGDGDDSSGDVPTGWTEGDVDAMIGYAEAGGLLDEPAISAIRNRRWWR